VRAARVGSAGWADDRDRHPRIGAGFDQKGKRKGASMAAQGMTAQGTSLADRGSGEFWGGTLAMVFGRLAAWIRTERRIRRDLAELRMLDDRSLADIGLVREHAGLVPRYARRLEGPE
jgi:uncharacterized protein YjiS (DUF1127 family)